MNKKKLYSKVIELLEEGNHPADIYEELVDEYGNLRKNMIFETVMEAYSAFSKRAVTA